MSEVVVRPSPLNNSIPVKPNNVMSKMKSNAMKPDFHTGVPKHLQMPTGQNDFATLTPAVERENYTDIGPGKYDPLTVKQIGSHSQLSTSKNDAVFSMARGKREQHHTKMIQSKDQAIESIGRHSPGAGRYESVNLDKIQLKSFAHQKKVGQIF